MMPAIPDNIPCYKSSDDEHSEHSEHLEHLEHSGSEGEEELDENHQVYNLKEGRLIVPK